MKSIKTLASIEALKSELAEKGFLLCDIQSVAKLPDSIWLEPKLSQYRSGFLLLVAHAGIKFWEKFSENRTDNAMKKQDPVDCYSAELSKQAIDNHLPDVSSEMLFPAANCPINLMALGKAFGWHSPSPLGMGIHRDYGLWSAYRAVWWLDMELPESMKNDLPVPNSLSKLSDICLQCQTHDCVTACPADAIIFTKNPNLSRCADYRLEDESQCGSTCLSRMACPYAKEHRYTAAQMSYHYELARSAIVKYRSQSQ